MASIDANGHSAVGQASPQRLYLIQLSATTVSLPTGPLEMITCCYLVQLTDGQNILIDTGLPGDYPIPEGATHVPGSETNVIEQLHRIGVRPDQVNFLIATHFDPDHSGYHDSFPQAEVIVQREHYEIARGGHPRYAKTRTHWDHPALRYRQIEGDAELFHGFRLIETSGHAPGHQSVLITLPKTGNVLLAIDAVRMARQFTPDRKPAPPDDNEEQLRASTIKLLDIVEQEHVALTVFGHDGEQWKTLKKAPEFYD